MRFDEPTPTCPLCGAAMKRRTSAYNTPFWGCAHFPGCRGTRPGSYRVPAHDQTESLAEREAREPDEPFE